MKKRNKKYNAKKCVAANGINVLKIKNNINFDGKTDLELHALSLIDIAKSGEMTISDFNDALHITVAAAAFERMGIGIEAMDYAEASNAALKSVHARYLRSGRIGFSGDEIKAFTDLINVYCWQLENASLLQTRNAVESANDFIVLEGKKNAKKSNAAR